MSGLRWKDFHVNTYRGSRSWNNITVITKDENERYTSVPFHQSDSSHTQLPRIRVTLARILRRSVSINIDATFVPHGAHRIETRYRIWGWRGEKGIWVWGNTSRGNPSTIDAMPRWGLVTIYVDRYLYYDVVRVSLVPERNNALVVEIDVYKTSAYLPTRAITISLIYLYYLPYQPINISVAVICIDTSRNTRGSIFINTRNCIISLYLH